MCNSEMSLLTYQKPFYNKLKSLLGIKVYQPLYEIKISVHIKDKATDPFIQL